MINTKSVEAVKAELDNLLPERCQECAMINRVALGLAEIVIEQEVAIEQVSLQLKSLSDPDCIGPMIEGFCGTKKKICQSPKFLEMARYVMIGQDV